MNNTTTIENDRLMRLQESRNLNKNNLPEEVSELAIEIPKQPEFLFLIFSLAVFKDFLDIVGAIFTLGLTSTILSIFFAILVSIWFLFKGTGVKRRLFMFILTRGLFLLGIGSIPLLSAIFPDATLFILLTHNKEKKIIQLFFSGLETLGKKI